jgi:hypothetical protein
MLLRCPPSSPLQPPAVEKRCLHMKAGGAPCRLCYHDHDNNSRSNFFGSNRTMSTSTPPQWPRRDERTASQGGWGGEGRRINVIVTISHISIQAADGNAEHPAYHHGLLPLDPFCAFTTFSLAIKRRGLETYVHFYVSVLHLILIDFVLES